MRMRHSDFRCHARLERLSGRFRMLELRKSASGTPLTACNEELRERMAQIYR